MRCGSNLTKKLTFTIVCLATLVVVETVAEARMRPLRNLVQANRRSCRRALSCAPVRQESQANCETTAAGVATLPGYVVIGPDPRAIIRKNTELLRRSPGNLQALLSRGTSYFAIGDFARSEQDLKPSRQARSAGWKRVEFVGQLVFLARVA